MVARRWICLTAAVAVTATAAGTGYHHLRTTLPPAGTVAEGVTVDGERLGPGEEPAAVAARHAARWRERRIRVTHEGAEVLAGSLADLGLMVDEAYVRRALASVAHDGDLWHRLDDAKQARAGAVHVTVPVRIPDGPIVDALQPYKRAIDRDPVPARWSFAEDRALPHQDGARLDPYRVVDAIVAAARAGKETIELPVEVRPPRATTEVVSAIDRSAVVSSYETRYGYVGNQVGRAQNLARASAGIDGLVLMPGQAMSFNDLVGPRSVENGFARAGEIYKGEMRMGTGGGTCQVASTLHAAAFFGGLDVVERSPHSRPSGYIGIGLDATVAYPTTDLKLRNPFDFPVVVHATAHEGLMRVELLGALRPAEVEYASSTVKVAHYKRKVRRSPWLPKGKVVRKQAGRKGMTIEKVRTIQYTDGTEKVETTLDVYPPTNEVYFVPSDSDPGDVLPPLPPGVKQI